MRLAKTFFTALLAGPLAAAFLMGAQALHAQGSAVEVAAIEDGGYTVEGDLGAAIRKKEAAVELDDDLDGKMAETFGDEASVDYKKGVVIKGPQTVTVARKDGTSAYYQVDGDVYAFAEPDTFRKGDAINALTGVIVFEAEVNGRLVHVADAGSISMIRG